jgi:DNA-binding XRE family transcriptional regulator
MNVHINELQTIEYNGSPAFVLVPFDLFRRIRPMLDKETVKNGIPHEIVRRNIVDSIPMLRAWREYLSMTQRELAQKAGVTQPAIAKLERADAKPRLTTLKKLAAAMNLSLEQLED